MAFTLRCRIVVDGRYTFYAVNQIDIDSSWREGDKATIMLPNRGVLRKTDAARQEVSIENIFSTGMSILVYLLYEGHAEHLEFQGYISKIKAGYPIELSCEDEMYQLKRKKPISRSYKQVTIQNLLRELVPSVVLGGNLPDITIDNFQINRATPAQVLEELRGKYGLAIYFRGKQLYAGLPFLEKDLQQKSVRYDLLKNIVEESLDYVKEKDVRIKVRAVSFMANNQKIEATAGDADGEERTIHFYKETNKAALQSRAEAGVRKYRYDGYRGELTGFGLPFCTHSMAATVFDTRHTECKEGKYLVESVKTSFGTGGFRRVVNLGAKING